MKNIYSYAVIFLLLSGCVHVPIDSSKLLSIESIRIEPEMKMTDEVAYSTFVSRSGGIIPIVGVAVEATQDAKKRFPKDMRSYLNQEKPAVGEIIKNEFILALQKDERFGKKLSPNGQARFVLDVYTYGLISKPFSMDLQATLGIQVTLMDTKGEVIWRIRRYALRNEELPARTFEELIESPTVLHESFKIASTIVMRKIFASE